MEPFRRSSRRAAAGAAEEGGADCGCGEAADGGARIDAEAPGAASTKGDAAASPERGRDDAGDADGAGGKEEGEKGGECTDNELTLPLLEATAGSSKGRRRAGSDKRPAGGEAGGADADSASSSSSRGVAWATARLRASIAASIISDSLFAPAASTRAAAD